MSAFSFRRLRAVLLLAAFSLALAGQALAAVTVTVPVMSAASTAKMVMHDSGGVMHCAACDRTNGTATMPSCSAALCWSLVAAPAQVARIEVAQAVVFAPPPDASPHGLAVRPEPHPPRLSTIV